MAGEAPIPFQLVSIKTNQFAILDDVFNENCNPILNINFVVNANEKKKIITLIGQIKYLCEESPYIILDLATDFLINDKMFPSFVSEDNSTFTIPVGFVRHLAVINVGTLRGVLHEKLKGTKFSNYVLPTVNVIEILKEDSVLRKVEEAK